MKHAAKLLALILVLSSAGLAAPTKENWDTFCAKCHGPAGDGQTKIGGERWIKDYTSPKIQAQFSDAGLLKNLLLGIRSEDGKERMPSFKDKLTIAEAKELVALIRSFQK